MMKAYTSLSDNFQSHFELSRVEGRAPGLRLIGLFTTLIG